MDPPHSYTRLFFTLLQCLHHRSIMKLQKDGHLTKAFSSKVQHLKDFIKPAFPGTDIHKKLNEEHNNWLHNITNTLGNHYTRGADQILSQIKNLTLPAKDIRHFSGQAIQWAKNRFGKKISPLTISYFLTKFHDLLTEHTTAHVHQTQKPSTPKHNPRTKQQPLTPHQNKKILNVRGADNPLSNFYPCSMEFCGMKFRSSEHAYQYQKACYFDCSDYLKQKISRAPTALAAKRVVDGLPITSDWNLFKPLLMFQILSAKFKHVLIFRQKLEVAFRSGAEIHHPVHDPFWGNGRDGNGKNWFGWSLQHLGYSKFGSLTVWENKTYKHVKTTTLKTQNKSTTIQTHNRFAMLDTTSVSETHSRPQPTTTPRTTSSTSNHPSPPLKHSSRSLIKSPTKHTPPISQTSPTQSTPTTKRLLVLDNSTVPDTCRGVSPPSTPLLSSPLLLTQSPSSQFSQSPPPTPNNTHYPPIHSSNEPSTSTSAPFSGTSYSDILTSRSTPAGASPPIKSRPKTLSKDMFYNTPSKRSAPSPTSSLDSPSTIPPASKRVRGTSPKQTSYPCCPNIHIGQPKSSWKLPPIEKPILVMGDSNLSKITATTNKLVQVESYPGARICHASTLLKNYSFPQHPEKIILSFGINNRSSEPRTTSFQNLRTLIGSTSKKFPKAKIFFPLVNFSYALPSKETSNLKEFNRLAQDDLRRVTIIPCLDSSQFETSDKDPVHWTKKSANSILKHWLNHLN